MSSLKVCLVEETTLKSMASSPRQNPCWEGKGQPPNHLEAELDKILARVKLKSIDKLERSLIYEPTLKETSTTHNSSFFNTILWRPRQPPIPLYSNLFLLQGQDNKHCSFLFLSASTHPSTPSPRQDHGLSSQWLDQGFGFPAADLDLHCFPVERRSVQMVGLGSERFWWSSVWG